MIKLRCACLVEIKDEKLLLVRVRDNDLWYFPGGKIETGEDAQATLIRECFEELSIRIIPQSIRFLIKIIGPAYLQKGEVELNCYSASWDGKLIPSAEISEVDFIDYKKNRDWLAPAICKFCDQHLKEATC